LSLIQERITRLGRDTNIASTGAAQTLEARERAKQSRMYRIVRMMLTERQLARQSLMRGLQ
jgi:hypothetical protein